MTITEATIATAGDTAGRPYAGIPVGLVAVDLYRDIHKGIRSELFAVTEQAGRLDPGDAEDRAALAAHLHSLVDLLASHAEHEDTHVQSAVEEHLPEIAETVVADHDRLERWIVDIRDLGDEAAAADTGARLEAHRLYLELAAFTSSYLAHQDLEERAIMPALDRILGPEGCGAIHGAIISSIPPDEMATSLALMLPAMNVDDRTEMLGGIKANAPAPAFEGIWSLAGSVLVPAELAAVADRLGLR